MSDCRQCQENTATKSAVGCDAASVLPFSCRVIAELALLQDLSAALSRDYELGQTLDLLFQRLETLRGLHHGLLTVVNRETNQIIAESSTHWPLAPTDRVVSPVGKDIPGLLVGAVSERAPVIVRDIASLPAVNLTSWEKTWLASAPSPAALLIVPIQHGVETIGTLSLFRSPAPDTVLESDIRLLILVAGQVGLAVRFRQIDQERLDTLRAENARLLAQIKTSMVPEGMIGRSSAMRMVYYHLDQVADSKTTVLIRGETGVGKERIAQAIWQGSSRKNKPFVRVNCASLPESLIESELFGHEKGAFTGALALRKGRFELAHTGTLFLDEFGEISLATQAKLLRVLQEGVFERVGGTHPIKVDVRVITATNRNLEDMIENGKFRLDLYYRINVFPIYIPPLRERRSDLLELADFFLEKYALQNRKRVARISTPAIDMLMAYHWPGNVRELENVIERAVLLTQDGVIHGFHLPPTLQTGAASDTSPRQTLQETLDSVEKEMLIEALKAHRGIMAKAARQLGLTERTIGLRVKAHAIDPRRFRDPEMIS